MSTAKHSPGPWIAIHDRHGGGAEIFSQSGKGLQVATTYGGMPEPQAIANRDLVIAAPELLATLKKIVKDARGDYNATEDTLVKLNARHIEVTALYAIQKVEPDFL